LLPVSVVGVFSCPYPYPSGRVSADIRGPRVKLSFLPTAVVATLTPRPPTRDLIVMSLANMHAEILDKIAVATLTLSLPSQLESLLVVLRANYSVVVCWH
jgi:predicted TPR repeat methyltransferase